MTLTLLLIFQKIAGKNRGKIFKTGNKVVIGGNNKI